MKNILPQTLAKARRIKPVGTALAGIRALLASLLVGLHFTHLTFAKVVRKNILVVVSGSAFFECRIAARIYCELAIQRCEFQAEIVNSLQSEGHLGLGPAGQQVTLSLLRRSRSAHQARPHMRQRCGQGGEGGQGRH